jgi:hypothetical protein
MRRFSIIAWLTFATMWLVACGGSSSDIVCEGGSTVAGCNSTGPTGVATISITSSTASIAADGSTTATITAVAKNSNSVVVSGATITFTTTAGDLTVTQATTDATGSAIATLAAGTAASGTTVTVTAADGSATAKTAVNVVAIQQTVTLTTSLPQIPSDGSKTALITALVRDANNNFVAGVPVSFMASSGGLTLNAGANGAAAGTTDANGMATATLSTAQDPTNRVITVTVTGGSAKATVPVTVTGSTLSVVGSPSLVLNSQGTYTVSLLNSSNAGIPGQTVTLTSANGNTVTPATFVTNSTGQQSVTLTATKSGPDTLTASGLTNLTGTQAVSVSAQSFQFTAPATTSTNVNLGVTQPLTVTWTVSGVPQANQTVSFAATRGTLSAATATTNASGVATVSIASTVAGSATVTASSTGVSAQTSIDFIATVPATLAVEASPATIATQGQSTITAVVRDALNNLVQNQTVDFQTVADTTGGTLSVASGITDSQGRAQTVYTASSTQSATNGVVVKATVQGTSISDEADITVGGQAVGLSLGTGALITEIKNDKGVPVQFDQPYTVIAIDSAGNPVANVPITFTVHALEYYKGGYVIGMVGSTSEWVQTGTPGAGSVTPVTSCVNEDDSEPDVTVNGKSAPNPDDFNGVLDPGEDGCNASGIPWNGTALGTGEACNASGNGNGKLDPGVTAVASPSSVTTDSTGTANFDVIYPESDALWVKVQIIATATVSGTETTASTEFVLPILATYLTTTTSTPPGYPSPFGTATQCNLPN